MAGQISEGTGPRTRGLWSPPARSYAVSDLLPINAGLERRGRLWPQVVQPPARRDVQFGPPAQARGPADDRGQRFLDHKYKLRELISREVGLEHNNDAYARLINGEVRRTQPRPLLLTSGCTRL